MLRECVEWIGNGFASPFVAISVFVVTGAFLMMPTSRSNNEKPTNSPTAARHAAPRFRVVDLGALGGSSYGHAINNQGQVIGDAEKPGLSEGVIFLWEKGHLQEIGTLPGKTASDAGGINEKGEIVGGAHNGGDMPSTQAIIYRNGKVELLFSDGRKSMARAINDRGEVVGQMGAKWFTHHAFLWHDGTVTDLGTLGGKSSNAKSINAAGHVVGEAEVDGRDSHAFLWKDGKMQDLGTLGGTQSYASRIKDNEQIVGMSTIGTRRKGEFLSHAFLWENGTMHDLSSPGRGLCGAGDINKRGQIVGSWWPENTGNDDSRALLWENGKMHDLNDLIAPDSGWVLMWAGRINEQGEIVGTGKLQGFDRAFLLIPKP